VFFIKRKLDLANYNRILGKDEIMKSILHEIEPIYRSLCTGYVKDNPRSMTLMPSTPAMLRRSY